MTGSLRDRARSQAGTPAPTDDTDPFGPDRQAAETAAAPEPAEPLPTIDYGDHPEDWLNVPVQVAWNRVMVDVQSVPKGDKMTEGPARYNYRGIDRVLNAVGPALRRHGVVVLPIAIDHTVEAGRTKSGGAMRSWNVTVRYEIRGPQGDTMPGCAAGEAFDTSDKGATKAQTIALRNFYIQALSLPTGDRRLDPEAQHIERGEQPLPTPEDYHRQMSGAVSRSRLAQIWRELMANPDIAHTEFVNDGAAETLLEMNTRLGLAMKAAREATKQTQDGA